MLGLMRLYAESYAVSYAVLGEAIVRFCPWSGVGLMESLMRGLQRTRALHQDRVLVSTKALHQDLHQDFYLRKVLWGSYALAGFSAQSLIGALCGFFRSIFRHDTVLTHGP